MATKPALFTILLIFSIANTLAGEGGTLTLKGTVLGPEQVIKDGFVSIQGSRISKVGSMRELGSKEQALETGGLIVPGLIDLHNHITWNLLPRWKARQEFASRYEWQADASYRIALEIPHAKLFELGLGCDANLYGEVKAIVNGATSVVGSFVSAVAEENKCIIANVRELDLYSGFQPGVLNREKLKSEVFPLEMPFDMAERIRSDLATGTLTAFLVHLAEGKPGDASSKREFRMLERIGLAHSGVSIVHGTALGRAEFREMASRRMGLVWSPRSNVELYGATTDVRTAKEEGVRIALAPDWSPSGSDGMLEELTYAATWNAGQKPPVFDDAELVRMVTSVPAQLAGVDEKIGALKEGLYADILVVGERGDSPYRTLLQSNAKDVRLVLVGGVALYGDLELMERLVPRTQLERATICGKDVALHIETRSTSTSTVKSWKEISASLGAALNAWGSELSEIAVCKGTNRN
jgi:5-methylthioadenosine/S-adenosylhomocysteine deaminase